MVHVHVLNHHFQLKLTTRYISSIDISYHHQHQVWSTSSLHLWYLWLLPFRLRRYYLGVEEQKGWWHLTTHRFPAVPRNKPQPQILTCKMCKRWTPVFENQRITKYGQWHCSKLEFIGPLRSRRVLNQHGQPHAPWRNSVSGNEVRAEGFGHGLEVKSSCPQKNCKLALELGCLCADSNAMWLSVDILLITHSLATNSHINHTHRNSYGLTALRVNHLNGSYSSSVNRLLCPDLFGRTSNWAKLSVMDMRK